MKKQNITTVRIRKKLKSEKNIFIFILIIICVLLFFATIVGFILNFAGSQISNDISQWAQFGDYVGGVLSPILAIINICIFIYLTLTVQSISSKNHEQALETNKQVALMGMKREDLNHFKTEMDKVITEWEADLQNIEKAKQVLYKYNVLEYRMSSLFPKMYNSEINKQFREVLVDTLTRLEKDRTARVSPSLFNVYGMLISELSKMVVE